MVYWVQGCLALPREIWYNRFMRIVDRVFYFRSQLPENFIAPTESLVVDIEQPFELTRDWRYIISFAGLGFNESNEERRAKYIFPNPRVFSIEQSFVPEMTKNSYRIAFCLLDGKIEIDGLSIDQIMEAGDLLIFPANLTTTVTGTYVTIVALPATTP